MHGNNFLHFYGGTLKKLVNKCKYILYFIFYFIFLSHYYAQLCIF